MAIGLGRRKKGVSILENEKVFFPARVINSIVLQDCCEVYQFVTPVVRTIDHSNASEIHDRCLVVEREFWKVEQIRF
jgi:hypothetical protein